MREDTRTVRRELARLAIVLTAASLVVWAESCGQNPLPPVSLGDDAGTIPDAGSPDAGPPDAGPPGKIEFPDAVGWQFYGPQNGGPRSVYGVTSDPSGNIWVAGGAEGLYLLKPGY